MVRIIAASAIKSRGAKTRIVKNKGSKIMMNTSKMKLRFCDSFFFCTGISCFIFSSKTNILSSSS